jgi:hypothetical protein
MLRDSGHDDELQYGNSLVECIFIWFEVLIVLYTPQMVVEDAMVEFFRDIIGTIYLDEHHITRSSTGRKWQWVCSLSG